MIEGYLESNDSDKSECVTLKVTKASHMLDIGQCSDFGTCKGVRNDGGSCRNYTNRSMSEYCVYHLQSAAKKLAARRGAFQAPTSAAPRCGRELKSIGNIAK
jgi:minichromosome maintenance protein 10